MKVKKTESIMSYHFPKVTNLVKWQEKLVCIFLGQHRRLHSAYVRVLTCLCHDIFIILILKATQILKELIPTASYHVLQLQLQTFFSLQFHLHWWFLLKLLLNLTEWCEDQVVSEEECPPFFLERHGSELS